MRLPWEKQEFFCVSLIVDNRAYPLNWLLLDKVGASNLREQQALIQPVLHWLKTQITNPIVVLGDREFHSVELAQWLGAQGVHCVLREKNEKQQFQTGLIWAIILWLTPRADGVGASADGVDSQETAVLRAG